MIVEDFAAGAAGPGIPHGPEVVFFSHTGKTLCINADILQPDSFRLFIFMKNRDPEFFRRQLQVYREKFPGKMNGFFFEVVAETEVTEHFKESMMACRVADIFQVIVLAPGTHAALGTGSALVGALVLISALFIANT